ncbi:MAG: glycosyltransferase [Janthinobacterium lividum]
MKILYLITGLRLGGAESQLLLLADNMQQLENKVLVVAMESGGVLKDSFIAKNINVVELDISDASTLISGYRKFKTIVNNFSPDVIHSHMIHANLFTRIFKLFNNKIKLICTAHNIREGSSILMNCYYLTRTIANWSTNVSKEAFDLFVQKKYFDPEKSSYVPNAIDTKVFRPNQYNDDNLRKQLGLAEDVYVYFTAGRLHEQKNHQMLLQAFKVIHDDSKQTVLIIAGEGTLQKKLHKKSIDLGISNHVHFLGRRNDIPALMSLCNCFVLSSKFEGFGLVIGEAMAMQKAVVATDCGGVKEVMGGYGRLVNVDDITSLADAMLQTYKMSYPIDYLNNARKYIENNYAVSLVVKQWTQLYAN